MIVGAVIWATKINSQGLNAGFALCIVSGVLAFVSAAILFLVKTGE